MNFLLWVVADAFIFANEPKSHFFFHFIHIYMYSIYIMDKAYSLIVFFLFLYLIFWCFPLHCLLYRLLHFSFNLQSQCTFLYMFTYSCVFFICFFRIRNKSYKFQSTFFSLYTYIKYIQKCVALQYILKLHSSA